MDGPKIKNYKLVNMDSFINILEKHYGKHIVRKISIIYDNNSKKMDMDNPDHNDWTQEQIKANKGSGNTYSIYTNHCKNDKGRLVCVDFDPPCRDDTITADQIPETEIFKALKETNTYYTITTRGYHFYFNVNDMPDYTQQQKIGLEGYKAIDLFGRLEKGNNIWEPCKGRKIRGNHLEYVDWKDISKFFNTDKMNIVGEKKEIMDDAVIVEPVEEELEVHTDNIIPFIEAKEIKSYLNRLDDKRYERSDWLKVGIALFNNFEGRDEGLNLWLEWSREDPVETRRSSINDINATWNSFNLEHENPISYKTLIAWANEDKPMNKWETIWLDGGDDAVVLEMNKVLCYIRFTGDFVLDFKTLDTFTQKKKPDLLIHYENQDFIYEDTDGNKKVLNPLKNIWLKSLKRQEYDRIVFDPRDNSPTCYNQWSGYKMDRYSKCVRDANIDDCQPALDHIKKRWCKGSENQYEYILDWFAMKLQKPWIKMAVVPCLKSKEGSGKNIILNMFKKIMDKYYISVANINQILGDFNGIIEAKMLIDLDEVSYGGNKAQCNKLKSLITEDRQVVNKKNKEMYEIDNYADYIITTNEYYFLYVDKDSRRFVCYEMDDELCGSQTPEKKAIINTILAVPAESFAKFLYNRDIENFNPREFLRTPLFQNQVELNWDSSIKYIHKCLESGEINQNPKIEWGVLNPYEQQKLKNGDIYTGYNKFYEIYSKAELGGYATRQNINEFYKHMFEIFGEGIVFRKYKNVKMVKLPPLDEARKLFNQHQNYDYKFGRDLDEIKDDELMDYSSDDSD